MFQETVDHLILQGVCIAWVLMLVGAVVILSAGEKVARYSSWISLVTSGIFLAATARAWFLFHESGWKALSWYRGWIGEDANIQSITIGLIQDPAGVSGISLVAVLSLIVLTYLASGPYRAIPQVFAGILLGTAGVGLAWISLTPWLSYVGIGLTLLGGVLSLGYRSPGSADEAKQSTRLLFEGVMALMVAVLGQIILQDAGLLFRWDAQPAIISTQAVQEGIWTVMIGLLLFLRPVPLLAWNLLSTESPSFVRLVSGHVLPSFAAFSLLYRMEPVFRLLKVFPGFFLIAAVCGFLAVCAALVQKDWKRQLLHAVPVLSMFLVGVLAVAGKEAFTSIMIGCVLGVPALFMCGLNLEASEKKVASVREKGLWTKIVVLFAIFLCTGVVGFISAKGIASFLIQIQDDRLTFAIGVGLFGLCQLFLWDSTWRILKISPTAATTWFGVFAPLLLACLGLGVIWVGVMSGGVLPQESTVYSAIWPRVFESAFGLKNFWADQNLFDTATLIYLGLAVGAIIVAYWTHSRWQSFHKKMPHFAGFLEHSFYLDRQLLWLSDQIFKWSAKLERGWVTKVWNYYFLGLARNLLTLPSRALLSVESFAEKRVLEVIRAGVQGSGKGLQILHNGDLQRYLLVSMGVGILTLLQFILRSK